MSKDLKTIWRCTENFERRITKALALTYYVKYTVSSFIKEAYIMAKMGRPRVESPRKVLSIRMSDEEMAMVKMYADKHGITVTQAIINGIKLMVKQEAKG